jgi:hypothetical protein
VKEKLEYEAQHLCYDETITGSRVENTFGVGVVDELDGSVECEGRDARAVCFVRGMENMLRTLYGVGDHDRVE